jgi:hypothetical protein
VLVVKADPADFAWLESRASCVVSGSFKAIKAVDASGRIHGMVGYDAWTPNSVTMSIALDNPACFRHLLNPMFEYPFLAAGRSIALVYVASTNARSLKLCGRVGFQEIARVRDGWERGADVLLLELRKEDCRYLRHRSHT